MAEQKTMFPEIEKKKLTAEELLQKLDGKSDKTKKYSKEVKRKIQCKKCNDLGGANGHFCDCSKGEEELLKENDRRGFND